MAGSRTGRSGSKAKGTTRKTATKRKTTTRSRTPRKNQPRGHSFLRDVLILASAGLAVFMGFAVYYPSFSDPAGPLVNLYLRNSIGIGMYVIPLVMACVPFLFFENRWRPRFFGAWLWSWGLTVLGALIGGCFTGNGWGGLLGDSAAALGRSYMGGYYVVLVAIISLLVLVRIVGWRPFVSIAKGGVQAGAMAVEKAGQLKEQIGEEAAQLREQREARAKEARQRLLEKRSKAEEALIAAELEVAEAPEDDSPIIREQKPVDAAQDSGRAASKVESTDKPLLDPGEGSGSRPSVRPVHSSATVVELEKPVAGDEFIAVVNSAGDSTTVSGTESGVDPDLPAAVAEAGPAGAEGTGAKDQSAVADEVGNDEPELPPLDDSNEKLRELAEGQAGHAEEQQSLFPGIAHDFVLPSVDLLKAAVPSSGEETHLEPRARIIERTLGSFNIDARCVNWVVGPRVTRYELKIGPGINVNKISNLADNLALELAVKAVRIEAPIPGMSAVGVEVPNASPDLVTLKDILTSSIFRNNNHPLTVAIGRDIAGNPIIANLAKMPHLLVAGATGSGKSVCLNTLIVSLLMRNTPETLRLILIDPKRVEMTSYEDVPQLACPVVCDVTQVQSALKWVVAEMDRRYHLLQKHKARNIATFNDSVERGQRLPFLVVVIDELADLMMLAGKAIEALICRITQLSRAVGIHMVIATQRPDVKVITGLIKANVPSRIAFAVVSNVDSRTILDGGGAEKLLGSGDMLFSPIGENVPLRVQGSFLSDDEINRVTEWCRSQAPASYDEEIMTYGADEDGEEGGSVGGGEDDDPLLQEAEQIVRSTGRASTSFLQRKLKIGYNRAARIMDELEFAEVVSPPDHAGNRTVLP